MSYKNELSTVRKNEGIDKQFAHLPACLIMNKTYLCSEHQHLQSGDSCQ